MSECIHGFDTELCAICSPREQPARPKAAAERPPARPRAAGSSPRSTPPARTPGRAPSLRESKPAPPIGARRIYHVTHLKNLESILIDGAIRAGVTPAHDLVSAAGREHLASIELSSDLRVPDAVPFGFSPDSLWWNAIRTGAADARWSAAARTTALTEYAVLVGTVAGAGDDVLVADGDPAAAVTRTASGADAASLIRRVAIGDPELTSPELWVPGEFPLSSVVLLALPNEPVRDRVRDWLQAVPGGGPRVVVYPPWFQPTVADDE